MLHDATLRAQRARDLAPALLPVGAECEAQIDVRLPIAPGAWLCRVLEARAKHDRAPSPVHVSAHALVGTAALAERHVSRPGRARRPRAVRELE